MANSLLLEEPPDDVHLWIPPDALPGIKILYTPGRNTKRADGRWSYLDRAKRTLIAVEISHTMSSSVTETPQVFANNEQPDKATLAELATFTDGTILQSLPLDIIGAGSTKGGPTGITHESAEEAGEPNEKPWSPRHLETKVRLSAWLISNPLLAAGDQRWRKLDIRYQLCRKPFVSRAEDGGLGDHTMWGLCSDESTDPVEAPFATNPWVKTCRSCPGWKRRGSWANIQFPNGKIEDIPLETGNFRDYFEQVGRRLAPPNGTPNEENGDEDMPTHRWAPKGFHNQFEMPGGLPVTPGDLGPTGTGNQADPFANLDLITEFHLHRLMAVIHRNGVTPDQIRAGYFLRNTAVTLTPGEIDAYRSIGIPI